MTLESDAYSRYSHCQSQLNRESQEKILKKQYFNDIQKFRKGKMETSNT